MHFLEHVRAILGNLSWYSTFLTMKEMTTPPPQTHSLAMLTKRKRRDVYQPDWESRCDNVQSFNDRSGQVLDQSYGKEGILARPSWGYKTVICTGYHTEHSWSGTKSGFFTTADTVRIPNYIQVLFLKKGKTNNNKISSCFLITALLTPWRTDVLWRTLDKAKSYQCSVKIANPQTIQQNIFSAEDSVYSFLIKMNCK